MSERTQYLREQAITCKNKVARINMPSDWTTQNMDCSLNERRAYATKMVLDRMPLYIGDKELIVGTRTVLKANPGNEDGHDVSDYNTYVHPAYVNEADVALFGFDGSFSSMNHMTPDFRILLDNGIDGMCKMAQERLAKGNLSQNQIDFLKSVQIVYEGVSNLIQRYADYAEELSQMEKDAQRKRELEQIGHVCRHIAHKTPRDLYDALQLLWFGELCCLIENHIFVNYGRLDVIFAQYLGEMDRKWAQQLIDCFLIKLYDQVDLNQSERNKFDAQNNLTLGGVDQAGNDAVNELTYMFLDGVSRIRLPEPLLALRINTKNPPAYLRKVCELVVSGINNVALYNDDAIVESLIGAGLKPEDARSYGFDQCQDLNIPGKSVYFAFGEVPLAREVLKAMDEADDSMSFEEFYAHLKDNIAKKVDHDAQWSNLRGRLLDAYGRGDFKTYFDGLDHRPDRRELGEFAMDPIPLLSSLFHGCIEEGMSVLCQPIPDKNRGMNIGNPCEGVNSLTALKYCCYDKKMFTLSQVRKACKDNFATQKEEQMRICLFQAPKWGNDDDRADLLAKDILEYCCDQILSHKTWNGGRFLAGIHQPHPVTYAKDLPATPDGRHYGSPAAVTLSPANGTMKNGATAALCSAAKLDHKKIQWNMCVMISYEASVFAGPEGAEKFEDLIKSYFAMGGIQHQPNVLDKAALLDAQVHPEGYKDLIVRLWGVSAHFVDLPREMQDELIDRFA